MLASIARELLKGRKANVSGFQQQIRCISKVCDINEENDHTRPSTPWVRSVISGVDLMRNAKYNKGLAFTHQERDRLYLRGLLPPAVLSQDVQAERVMLNLRSMAGDLPKGQYLMSLQERNERLFFYVLENYTEELLPLLEYPALGHYCKSYSLMFRSLPRGLYLSLEDKGHVFSVLKNWPERRVKAICLTDGERVGTLGDLGVQAIGAPISRLALLTACGGIDPSTCLPVTIDNGTDREELLQDPIYVGARHRRVRGDAYLELVDEFFAAVRQRFGSCVLIDFSGMRFETEAKLLNGYRGVFPVYSDCHYGFPTLVLAAVLASRGLTGTLAEHRFMLVGESPALTAVAELLEEAIQRESRAGTVLEARKAIWMVDGKGLVVRDRGDTEDLEDHKLPYIQEDTPTTDLAAAIRHVKPTVLIGLSEGPPAHAFTKDVCEAMAESTARPIILPLSRRAPDGTDNGCEVSAADAYAWTKGSVLYASKSAVEPMKLSNGSTVSPSQLSTAMVYPGVALATIVSRATRLREDMFVEAAKALASHVSEEELNAGALLPSRARVRDAVASVAAAMATKAYHIGVATELPKPHDLLDKAYQAMYISNYKRYK